MNTGPLRFILILQYMCSGSHDVTSGRTQAGIDVSTYESISSTNDYCEAALAKWRIVDIVCHLCFLYFQRHLRTDELPYRPHQWCLPNFLSSNLNFFIWKPFWEKKTFLGHLCTNFSMWNLVLLKLLNKCPTYIRYFI